jgi:hypothetical protein
VRKVREMQSEGEWEREKKRERNKIGG